MLEDIERLKGETSVREERYKKTIENNDIVNTPKYISELG